MTYQTKKLGEVVDFKTFGNTKHLPFVGMEDVESDTGRFIGSLEQRRMKSTTAYFDTKSVLYGKLRPYLNKVLVPDFEGHCSTEFVPLRPDLRILTREWLALWLRSEFVVSSIMSQTSGSRMPRANINFLKNLCIPVPSVGEQKRIVAKIERQFAKIDEAARLRAESEALAAQILPAALHEIFSSAGSKGWEEKSLSEVCGIQSGGTPNKNVSQYWDDGDIPWLRSEACRDTIVDHAEKFISREGLDNSSARMFKAKTTLIALVGATIGRTGFLMFESTTNQNIAGLYPKSEDELHPEYLFAMARGLYPKFLEIGAGKFKMANLTFIKSLKIPIPPLAEQKRIVKKLDALSEKVRALRELQSSQASDLKALKQSILHEAFTN